MNRPDQDWEPVILRKPGAEKKTETVRKTTGSNVRTIHVSSKSANNFDPENMEKPKMTNTSLGKAIQTARMQKKMTQKDLDRQCNLPKNTVQDYENDKAVYVPAQVNAMARVLGVTLPRPKK